MCKHKKLYLGKCPAAYLIFIIEQSNIIFFLISSKIKGFLKLKFYF